MNNLLKAYIPATAVIILLFFAGCKKSTPANQAFVGTYTGEVSEVFDTSSVAALKDTFVIKASNLANQISMLDLAGEFSLVGNVSNDSIVSIEGIFNTTGASCSAIYFSGTGSLNGLALNLYCSAPITCAGPTATFQMRFFGLRE